MSTDNRPKVSCSVNSGDVKDLVDLAEQYLKYEENHNEVDPQYAYEALMEFVYGKEVWDYINNLEE